MWNCALNCATFAPRSTVEKWIGARSASKGCRGWWRALFGNLKKLLALGPEGVEECSGGRSPAVEVAPLFISRAAAMEKVVRALILRRGAAVCTRGWSVTTGSRPSLQSLAAPRPAS